MVRPYQRCIVPERITGIVLDSANPHVGRRRGRPFSYPGRAELLGGRQNPLHYVTAEGGRAHSYYLAKLASKVSQLTGGMPARRLAEIFDVILVDEMQDLVGWDFSVLRVLAEAGFAQFECVGDFRQTVYQTSEASKRPQTSSEKLAEFQAIGFEVENLAISWRCIQSICDLADLLHTAEGRYPRTESMLDGVPAQYCDHNGIYAVSDAHLDAYIEMYSPVILRWSRAMRRELCDGKVAYNFGEAKGLGFDRVLILPTDKHARFLGGNASVFDDESSDDSKNKLYVGITRARYSLAFSYSGGSLISGAQVWRPGY